MRAVARPLAEVAVGAPKSIRPEEIERPSNANDMETKKEPSEIPKASRPCAVELFAGSAGLSARLWDHGFDVVAIDSKFNKHSARKRKNGAPVPIVPVDLTKGPDQDVIKKLVSDRRPQLVWMSLPSGSFSVQPTESNKHAPVMRDSNHPEGLPSVRNGQPGELRKRLEDGNEVASFSMDVANKCDKEGIPWVIEAPTRSWFWELPRVRSVLAKGETSAERVDLGLRSFGCVRDKKISLMGSAKWLGDVKAVVANPKECVDPKARPPGLQKRSIALDCEYPAQLCSRVAHLASAEIGLKKRVATREVDPNESRELPELRASVGSQPRAKNHRPLVPEFKRTARYHLSGAEMSSVENKTESGELTSQVQTSGGILPKGAKILTAVRMQGEKGAMEEHARWVVELGLEEWSPQEFVKEASNCEHPFLAQDRSLDDIKGAILRTLQRGPTATTAWRRARLAKWRRRAEELESREKALHATLDPDIARVLEGKKLLLLHEILTEIGHPDRFLVEDMMKGFQVLGMIPPTGAFERQACEDPLPVSDLLACARNLQAAAINSTKGSGDKELDLEVTRLTEKEAEEGRTLLGPFTAKELERKLGPLWIPSRRFGIRQGSRVREIDDFSEFLVNLATGIQEKIRPEESTMWQPLGEPCDSQSTGSAGWPGYALQTVPSRRSPLQASGQRQALSI